MPNTATTASVSSVISPASSLTSSSANGGVYGANRGHVLTAIVSDVPYSNVGNGEPTNGYAFHAYYAFVYGFHAKVDSDFGN